MKLDRNITNPKRGKYALIKLRDAELRVMECTVGMSGHQTPTVYEIRAKDIDFGDTDDTDFFVIRLKDKYAAQALIAYSEAARRDGEVEYAEEIAMLAHEALFHPNKQMPT